jgi:hypothetical protein
MGGHAGNRVGHGTRPGIRAGLRDSDVVQVTIDSGKIHRAADARPAVGALGALRIVRRRAANEARERRVQLFLPVDARTRLQARVANVRRVRKGVLLREVHAGLMERCRSHDHRKRDVRHPCRRNVWDAPVDRDVPTHDIGKSRLGDHQTHESRACGQCRRALIAS